MTRFIFSLLYDTILTLALLLMVPKSIIRLFYRNNGGATLRQRLGYGVAPLDKGSRKLVWIHAVSLGETKAVTALAEQMRNTLNDPIIVVSSITATGHAEARKAMPFADRHLYLPMDYGFIMKRLLRKITPDLVVITETDYWYHFLSQARDQGASLVVVNGKLSERTTRRYRWFPALAANIFGLFDAICVQSDEYRNRFIEIGISPTKLTVTGNLKFDATMPTMTQGDLSSWRQRLGLADSDRVITAGSTHAPEESLILDACRELWKDYPNLKLLLVPRHPERFDEVAELLRRNQIAFRRYSEGAAGDRDDTKVVLIDAMGVLKECYQVSEAAIVAGSFTPRVGGHNILEPCHYGLPALFGPHMHSQPELERLVLEAGAGIQVEPEGLTGAIKSLLADAGLRQRYAEAARRLIAANRGAVQRTLNEITATTFTRYAQPQDGN